MSARIFAPLGSRERLLQPNPIFNGFWASRFRGRIRIIKESLLIPKGSPIFYNSVDAVLLVYDVSPRASQAGAQPRLFRMRADGFPLKS